MCLYFLSALYTTYQRYIHVCLILSEPYQCVSELHISTAYMCVWTAYQHCTYVCLMLLSELYYMGLSYVYSADK